LEPNIEPGKAKRRTLGILGGMGPLATAHFYQRLVESSSARLDQEHPRVVMVSDPAIPDRSAFILGEGVDPRPHLTKAAVELAQLGAEKIVVPCNSASPFRHDIQEAAGVEIVDWVGIASAHLVDYSEFPIGIAATSGTLRAGFYQEALAVKGVSYVLPGPVEEELIMRSIYGPSGVKTVNKATEEARVDLSTAIEGLVAAGAGSVLLACTELPILATLMTDRPVPFIDPGDLVVAEVLRWLEGDSEMADLSDMNAPLRSGG